MTLLKGWNPGEFEALLGDIKEVTREEDKSLPDLQDVITEALDSLFGDYTNLKQRPKGDLGWLGKHVFNDVTRLKGPAVSARPALNGAGNQYVPQPGSVQLPGLDEAIAAAGLSRTLPPSNGNFTRRASAATTTPGPLSAGSSNRDIFSYPTPNSEAILSPLNSPPPSVVELPHRKFTVQGDWKLETMEEMFGEGRAGWSELIDHFVDGSWYYHDDPNSKFQQVFKATMPPGYKPHMNYDISYADIMSRKRPMPDGDGFRRFNAMEPAVPKARRIDAVGTLGSALGGPSASAISRAASDLGALGPAVPPPNRAQGPACANGISNGHVMDVPPQGLSLPGLSNGHTASPPPNDLVFQRVKQAQDPKSLSRAAERRSREKLNNSMQELILAVPGLAEANPKKAMVIDKAVSYLQELKKQNSELQSMVQELNKVRALEQTRKEEAKKNLADLVTIEIVSGTFHFIYVDSTWERVMGYSAQDVIGKATHDFFSCTKCAMIMAISLNIKQRLEAGLDWKGVMMFRRANGDFVACWGHMYGNKDENGNFLNYVCTRKNFVVLEIEQQQALCDMQQPPEDLPPCYSGKGLE